MAQMNISFTVPKHNILKLGKIFDLDTIETDEYELVVLSDITGLNKNNLDTVDSNIANKEASNYTRVLIEMTLEETVKGYAIGTNAIEVMVNDITTVKGLLMVKRSSQDILACCLNMTSVVVDESFTVSSQSKLMPIEMED